jgi:hypothetical protein
LQLALAAGGAGAHRADELSAPPLALVSNWLR